MKIQEINIKENYPPVDIAISDLLLEIERANLTDTAVLKVIHGYGSHGRGGEIKKNVRILLKKLKQQGKILDYVCGEHISQNTYEQHNFIKNYPELLLAKDIINRNSGLTLVFLDKR